MPILSQALRMRNFLNIIKGLPHVEERPTVRLEARTASPQLFFCRLGQFPDTLIRRDDRNIAELPDAAENLTHLRQVRVPKRS
jgi:hypothetical protein